MKTVEEDKDAIIAKLQEEVEELRTVISLMPGNVYWQDTKGLYQGCNINNAKLLNLDPKDIIGKSSDQLLKKEYVDKVNKTNQQVFDTKQEISVEEIGYDNQSNRRIFLTHKKPLFDSHGVFKGVLGISFDITDRKRNEKKLKTAKQKAEIANQAKSQFLAMISHELRTPLTSILGFANLIESRNLPAEKRGEYLQHIINSGAYLLSLINSLLDYNKLETNKVDMVLLPLNLKELLLNLVSMLDSNAKPKGLALTLEYDNNAPQRIVSNNRALSQVLINLIGNAIKFTEKGGVSVIVKCIKTTSKSTTLEIAVKDTGIGIPPEEQELIFKSFYQSGNAYTRNNSLNGTGLGLAIVKKLIKLINGKIEVESTLGVGSTFTITANFATIASDETPWLPYATNVRILVAQDETKNNYIEGFLANSIYELAPSKEVLNYLLSAQRNLQPYDILIIDEDQNNVDGNSILHSVRTQNDLHQPLLILLTTDTVKIPETNFYGEVYINPTPLNSHLFQTELKTAWENWQARATKHPTHCTASCNFNVLLVEDNALIQIIHKSMLEELGCKVDIADSATQTLQMLENNYDMLFVDIGLRDITGFELITHIRKLPNVVAHVPIIVLTGYSEEEERQHCIRVGANEVAIKPVSKDTLEKILKKYIRHDEQRYY